MKDRVPILLALMLQKNIDAYIVSSSDEFQNELPPQCNKRLQWLTSFSGSNGVALITKKKSILFTDGRYLLQAREQLDEELFTICDVSNYEDTAAALKRLDINISYDPNILSVDFIERWGKIAPGIKLLPLQGNLVDVIWQRSRSLITKSPMFLSIKYTGISTIDKIKLVTNNLNYDYVLITIPTSVCWLLNIRGKDTDYTPIIMCYCLIKKDGSIELFSHLQTFKKHYEKLTLFPFLEYKQRFLNIVRLGCSIQFSTHTPIWFLHQCPQAHITRDPCEDLKSVKNAVELSGIEFSHRQDGVALLKLMKWMTSNIGNGITEMEIDQRLEEFKRLGNLYVHRSFATIAGFAKNGAIIHYQAKTTTNLKLNKQSVFLLDSGSQYKAGTTDVTRTFHFGSPTSEQKKHYTLVLKCLIKLSSLHFPKTTTGSQLDGVAREFLWKHGLDYPHATGHGVGHYLSVHEGPVAISKHCIVSLEENMVLSIEPGLYFNEGYGIRIENLVVVKASVFNNFLTFQTLTKVPISTNLIDYSLLHEQEIIWLKDYHENIFNELSPYLSLEERIFLQDIYKISG
jgi:Xaa-Pro aminopeptidase